MNLSQQQTITRNQIMDVLKVALEPLPYVYALWLEGADANGTADAYSDLDIYIDFDDHREAEVVACVEGTLETLAPFDYKHVMAHPHPKLRQRVYHLKGTPDYWLIDFCYQLHSRDRNEYCWIEGDTVEATQVIFDKAQVIRYKDFALSDFKEAHLTALEACDYRYSQHLRVIKYVHRGQLPEALAYYQRYVVEPIVILLRMLHTPAHIDYHLLHISQHLPKAALNRLEDLLTAKTLADIHQRTLSAQDWYATLRSDVLRGLHEA